MVKLFMENNIFRIMINLKDHFKMDNILMECILLQMVMLIQGLLIKDRWMAKEQWNIKMEIFVKELGKIIY